MKDSVKEFENLNNRIETLFEGLSWINPQKWFKDKPKSGEYTRSYSGKSPELTKHLYGIESGEECTDGFPNKRFISELGSYYAEFLNKNFNVVGKVKNIKPFLENAGISKRFLRCYDLKKDKLKISWLFNGEFEAEVLDWDKKKKKVIFQGKWKNGIFGGISTSQSKEEKKSPLEYKYYILIKGKESGPYSVKYIVDLYKNGKLKSDSIVRKEESNKYQNIIEDDILSFLIKSLSAKSKVEDIEKTKKIPLKATFAKTKKNKTV